MLAPREGGISFPQDEKKAESDDDDDFDTVEEKKRGDHASKRGGFRGGRGGRGAHTGEERSDRPDRPHREQAEGDSQRPRFFKGDKKEGEQKQKKIDAPVKIQEVVINTAVKDTKF